MEYHKPFKNILQLSKVFSSLSYLRVHITDKITNKKGRIIKNVLDYKP
jgi:hypothetical protein